MDVGTATGPFINQGFLMGLRPDGVAIMDLSQDGAIADQNGDGDPTNDNEGTEIEFMFDGLLGVAKRVSKGPILSTNGCYDITFEINVENYGTVNINNIQVVEDLDAVFSPNDVWLVTSIESEEFQVNTSFNGISDLNLLVGNDVLISAPNGDNGSIYLMINVCPSGDIGIYENSVVAMGLSPDGQILEDVSTNGSVPDADGDGDPTNDSEPTPFQLECEVPQFTNCPRPNIVVDAPEGWCSSFANFSPPLATAQCGLDTIIQVDLTGLNTGDLFPVGTTILKWVAYDKFGNASDTCELKVIVNDFHTPPTLEVPADMTLSNDPFTCGAVANNIGPVAFNDNCIDNTAVVFEVTDVSGNILNTGINDASGTEIPVGVTTVTYHVQDQPILLITEVFTSGLDAIEITNFGPASMDISCLVISRKGSGIEEFVVPDITIVGVGETYVYYFSTEIGANEAVGYSISYGGHLIDAVATYAYTIDGFSGDVMGGDIIRNSVVDHDNQLDWTVATTCNDSNIGVLNPGLSVFADNGTTTSLQSTKASKVSDSFTITRRRSACRAAGLWP